MTAHQEEAGREPEDPELGEPIAALSALAWKPAPGLVARIRRSIQRRLFASHVAELTWSGPREVFTEFLRLVFELFGTRRHGNGDGSHD